jgi:urease accessory protein
MQGDVVKARLLKEAPSRADDSVVLDYDGRLLRRKLLTSSKRRGFELDGGYLVRIDPAPESVLVVVGDLTRLAWHIGNRHTPCQILPDRLVIRDDHVLERMLQGLGATITRADLPFKPEGGAYGHGRTMGHSHAPEETQAETRADTFGWHHHGDGQLHFHAPKPVKTRL